MINVLTEAFTRNLVYFGVIDVLFVCFGLFLLTKLISSNSKKNKFICLGLMILDVCILLIINYLAVKLTGRF